MESNCQNAQYRGQAAVVGQEIHAVTSGAQCKTGVTDFPMDEAMFVQIEDIRTHDVMVVLLADLVPCCGTDVIGIGLRKSAQHFKLDCSIKFHEGCNVEKGCVRAADSTGESWNPRPKSSRQRRWA